MSNPEKDHQELIEKLRQMRRVAARDPERTKEGQDRFLSALEALGDPPQATLEAGEGKQSGASSFIGRLSRAAVGLALAGFALFSLGLAAQASLPDQALHPLKLRIEEIEVGLQADGAQRARLLLRNSSRRLEEIRNLIGAGRAGALDAAIDLYIEEINQLNAELAGLQRDNGEDFAALLSEVSDTLSEHEAATRSLLDSDVGKELSTLERVLILSSGKSENEKDEGPEDALELGGSIVHVSPARGEVGRQMRLYIRAEGANFGRDSQAVFEPGGAIQVLEVILLSADELVLRIQIEPESEADEFSFQILDGQTRWEGGEFAIFVADQDESLESDDHPKIEDTESEEADSEAGEDDDNQIGEGEDPSDGDNQEEDEDEEVENEEEGEDDD